MFFAMTKAEPSRTASGRYRIKGGGGTQMKGPNKALQTVSMIVGLYLISISLSIAIIVVRIKLPDAIPKRVHLMATCLWLLNTAFNPIIYVYNNPMFRAHVKRLIMRRRGDYTTNSSSFAASTKRRITQQSVIVPPSPSGGQFRSNNQQPIQRSSTTVSLMSVTLPERRKSELKNMNVVVEEGDKEEVVNGHGGTLVIENRLAEANGNASLSNSYDDSISFNQSKDESAV